MAKGANQWTKLQEANSPEAKRAKERWQDRYQAGALMDELAAHYKGERELSSTQIKAIELVLDRVAPKLSAVEQVESNPLESMTQEQRIDMVRALITANPALLTALNLAPKPVVVSQDEAKAA